MLILKFIDTVFLVYWLLLLVRIFGSWFPEFSRSRLMQFVAFYTDPYLNIFRRIIPPLGMLDISPIIAFIALQIIQFAVRAVVIAIL
ncbi:MAG: YggT family protein [Parachlamydiaceae bacterium]|nr:YggT family protein [Parachlamydiaceae bacterium]